MTTPDMAGPTMDASCHIVAFTLKALGRSSRGTMEGFKKISSKQKWLEIHGRKKWAYYYVPENVAKQRAFFDHFLKGQRTEIDAWPKVRLEVRDKYYVGDMRAENEWPVARTQYTKLFLDATSGKMSPVLAPGESASRYSALGSGPGAHRAEVDAGQSTFVRK